MAKIKQLSVITNLQIVFWIAFVFLSTYSFNQTTSLGFSIIRAIILVLLNAILFYSCYLYLIPRYFEQKKYTHFYILLTLLIAFITTIRLFLKSHFFDLMQTNKISISYNLQVMILVISELIVVLISSLMKVAEGKYEYEKKYQETQNQFLESELQYLKSQVSPHFLLNTLNNIYSFAVVQSPETPNAILKLSTLLKYFLYESSRQKITISRELEMIQAYIDLFQLRFQYALPVSTHFSIQQDGKEIEPLLLMSLVENAFKHSGIGIKDDAFIHISAEEIDSNLVFSSRNSKMEVNETISQYGGIGLKNIAKRLLLNYPGKHSLNIMEDEHSFSVKLIIPFV